MYSLRIPLALSIVSSVLTLVPTAHGQSVDWDDPDQAHSADMSDEYWWNPSDPRMVKHPNDGTHWYEDRCCNNKDCRGFSPTLVTEYSDGTIVLTLPPYKNFPGMVIPFDTTQITDRPSNAHGDTLWHLCFSILVDELRAEIYPATYCAYPPTPST